MYDPFVLDSRRESNLRGRGNSGRSGSIRCTFGNGNYVEERGRSNVNMKVFSVFVLFVISFVLGNDYPSADATIQGRLVSSIQACGVDASKIRYYDLKADWQTGHLPDHTFILTIQRVSPADVAKSDFGAFNPLERSEVNFLTEVAGGKYKLLEWENPAKASKVLGKIEACQFIFAFPWIPDETGVISDATVKVPKALKQLGWLPNAGSTSFLYVVSVPKGTPYASTAATIAPATEIAFPSGIQYKWIVHSFVIDSRGTLTAPAFLLHNETISRRRVANALQP